MHQSQLSKEVDEACLEMLAAANYRLSELTHPLIATFIRRMDLACKRMLQLSNSVAFVVISF